MKDTMKTPCSECPFLKKYENGYTLQRLREFALTPNFPCHLTCDVDEDGEDPTGDFVPNENTVVCAGAKIFLAKRKDQFNYGFDDSKLNLKAEVR